MVILFPFIKGENITQKGLLIGIPVWTVGGFLFGYTMKRILGKRKSKVAE